MLGKNNTYISELRHYSVEFWLPLLFLVFSDENEINMICIFIRNEIMNKLV